MRHEFNPPRYTWTASTAEEAKNALQAAANLIDAHRAAADLIDAHLATLAPGNSPQRYKAKESTPVSLTVSLDLYDLIEQINTKHTLDSLDFTFGGQR
ncbi:hypothetical protein ACH4LN_17930 [Streptomyces albus]|uniref:hypothetical protein n=1 Tax=Streptomyces albus TaxID=1888 RepID=UPI0037B236CD